MPAKRTWIFLMLFPLFSIHSSIANKGLTHLGFGFNNEKKSVTIPFTSFNNLIIIESQIDEKHKLNLILDTGVRSLVLFDKSYLPEISAHTFNVRFTGAGTYEPIEAEVSVNHNLRLCEDVVANQINAVILNQSNKQLHEIKGIKIHGAFGYQLFTRFIVKIDYRNHLITLTEPEKAVIYHGFKAVPLTIRDTKPFIKTEFLTRRSKWCEMNLLLDLGANHQVLLHESANIKTTFYNKRENSKIAEGLSGSIYGKKGFTKGIRLGSIDYKNSEILIPTKSTYHQEQIVELEKHGSIGGRFFNDAVIILDYANGNLFIENKEDKNNTKNYLATKDL